MLTTDEQVAPGGGLVCGQADGGDTSPRVLARKASDLAASAASRASGIFNCAADTVHAEKDNNGDDFFEGGKGGHRPPNGAANLNEGDAEISNAKSVVAEAAVGVSAQTPSSAPARSPGDFVDDFDLLAAGARIFDCAADTVHRDGNNDEGDDFFENGRAPRVPPTGNDYRNNDGDGEWEDAKSEVPEADPANKPTALTAVDGGSAKTSANDEEAVHRTTATPLDEMQMNDLPSLRAAVITVDSGNDDDVNVESEKLEGAPSPNRRKRLMIVLGLIALLVAIAVSVGVALQQTRGNDASSLEQNEVHSGTLGAPTARPSPTDAPIKDSSTGEIVVYPPAVGGVPSPSTAQTPSPNANTQLDGTGSPNQSAFMDTASPDSATAGPVTSGNEVGPSQPSISWDEFNPTTASPSRRPSQSAETGTTKPSLRPETAKPTTESPATGRPINPAHSGNEPAPLTSNPTIRTLRTPTQLPTKQPSRKPTQLPTKQPSNRPSTTQPTARPNGGASFEGKTPSGPLQSTLTIELQTDEYGEETSWSLYSIDAATGLPIALVASVEEDTYESFEQDRKELTLSPGKYRFILKDKYGDGFCCNNGREGWYTISLDGRELIRGAYYMRQVRYDIIVGYDWSATMSERDGEWLEAHNSRRKTWHERYGETYVPLMWSQELASDALSWANELLNDCEIEGISHESDVEEGENLAKNKATAPGGMGKLYPPDYILRRWVDQEENWGWPRNAHLTQALWRASKYVGCGDGVKEYADGSICRTQVCRYARAGNCVMGQYDAEIGDNWLVPMLEEHSRCGPTCPPREGCY